MKRKQKNASCLFLLALLLINGCASDRENRVSIGSEIWETMPALSYGTFESDKLEILAWNSGRAEATSFDRFAETSLGYYMSYNTTQLHYADKSNLGYWTPVCNQPDCEHVSTAPCNAYMRSQEFIVRDNRIYYLDSAGKNRELYSGDAKLLLMSMAPDGTDKRFEYAAGEKNVSSRIVSYMGLLTSQHWLFNMTQLDSDGSQTVHTYRITENGCKVSSVTGDSPSTVMWSGIEGPIYGDRLLITATSDLTELSYYRYVEDEIESLKLDGLPVEYAYLSGDTMRFFRTNDGYYDINIQTGDSVKLAPPQLKNSLAGIVLPNCIIESTLMGYQSFALRTENMKHQMVFFDGQQWHSIKLPESLEQADKQVFLGVLTVTSDSIIFYCRDMATYRSVPVTTYYRIDLTKQQLELEKIAELTQEWYVLEQKKNSK